MTESQQPAHEIATLADLARALRELRRRHARRVGDTAVTYRALAAATGWSHGIIGEYLSGKVLPPTDRFDVLVRLLGAGPAEQGALATARDRVDEHRRNLPGPAAPVPRQLPADVFGFTGRDPELAELDTLLRGGGNALVITAVAGAAGVGKTALAVRWAHRAADQFPDGQLYLDLRGYGADEPVSPGAALATFLRALGVDGAAISRDVDERAAQYRTLLANRRMLVVLDNARTIDQVRPLLPGTSSSAVLVTSRDTLAELVIRDGARRLTVDRLTTGDALDLLSALIGSRVREDPGAAEALAQRCGRMPLALRIAAEMAATHPELTLADIVADLRLRRLDDASVEGTAIEAASAVPAVFSWSHQHLSADGARAFAALGLHPGRDVDANAVAALLGVAAGRAAGLLEELARAHLVAPVAAGRYTMHDLLRGYAEQRARTAYDPPAREAALTRLFDFYVSAAATATHALFPHDRRPATPPAYAPMPALSSAATAQRWLDEQRPNLVAVAVHAGRHGWPRHGIDLSRLLWRYLEVGSHYQDALVVHGVAVHAADADGYGRAAALANLGNTHWCLGAYREALECFERALAGHRDEDDAEGEARALARLGVVQERLGELGEALHNLHESLALYRKLGNRHGEGAQLVNLGAVYRRLGRFDEAAEHLALAAASFVEIGDLRLEGYSLGNLGAVYSLVGRHPEALTHLEAALQRCRSASDRGGEGSALAALGSAHVRMADYPRALDLLCQALAISREIGERSLETETLNAMGELLAALSRPTVALRHHRRALKLARKTGDRYEQARALAGMGDALQSTGRPARARRCWRTALTIYAGLAAPEASRVRVSLGRPLGLAPGRR